MAVKFIDLDGLSRAVENLKALFVAKEKKTGSQTEYKVLSDNNLTDELKQKILDAGSSSFTGAYSDLTGKPSIEGHEVKSGANTAASLGLETPSGAQSKADAAKSAAVTEVKALGYQTAAQVESSIAAKGYQTSAQVEGAIAAKGYDTAASVDSKVGAAKTEMQSAINTAVASVWKAKGSTAFASLPALTAARQGDVWNITDSFTTTADFIEGAGKRYEGGTNVACVLSGSTKKWDVLAGLVDMSGYLKPSDMVPITRDEIDALFA